MEGSVTPRYAATVQSVLTFHCSCWQLTFDPWPYVALAPDWPVCLFLLTPVERLADHPAKRWRRRRRTERGLGESDGLFTHFVQPDERFYLLPEIKSAASERMTSVTITADTWLTEKSHRLLRWTKGRFKGRHRPLLAACKNYMYRLIAGDERTFFSILNKKWKLLRDPFVFFTLFTQLKESIRVESIYLLLFILFFILFCFILLYFTFYFIFFYLFDLIWFDFSLV